MIRKKMLITATDGILMSANKIVKRTLVITDSLRGRQITDYYQSNTIQAPLSRP